MYILLYNVCATFLWLPQCFTGIKQNKYRNWGTREMVYFHKRGILKSSSIHFSKKKKPNKQKKSPRHLQFERKWLYGRTSSRLLNSPGKIRWSNLASNLIQPTTVILRSGRKMQGSLLMPSNSIWWTNYRMIEKC